MNDVAREVLVQAWLSHHPQAFGFLHSPYDDSDCALGVLHLAHHKGNREEATKCSILNRFRNTCWYSNYTCEFTKEFKISIKDEYDITRANDLDRWDFITIARKVGVKENLEEVIPQP